jgi:LemA protein
VYAAAVTIVNVGIIAIVRALVLGLVVVALIVVGVVIWAIGVNNQLVTLEQNVNEKWAQVQNVYQRRADLIPNLVETVKGFAAQERTVLNEVTEARASATSIRLTPEALNDPQALARFQAAQNQLSGALSRLLVTVERYPELKSNANFLALQTQLGGRRTASPSSGSGTTRRCASTTRGSASSRPASSPA